MWFCWFISQYKKKKKQLLLNNDFPVCLWLFINSNKAVRTEVYLIILFFLIDPVHLNRCISTEKVLTYPQVQDIRINSPDLASFPKWWASCCCAPCILCQTSQHATKKGLPWFVLFLHFHEALLVSQKNTVVNSSTLQWTLNFSFVFVMGFI